MILFLLQLLVWMWRWWVCWRKIEYVVENWSWSQIRLFNDL